MRNNKSGFRFIFSNNCYCFYLGGIVMGMGIESSCHIHGLFHHTCVSYELILGDGSLVTCSKVTNYYFLIMLYNIHKYYNTDFSLDRMFNKQM